MPEDVVTCDFAAKRFFVCDCLEKSLERIRLQFFLFRKFCAVSRSCLILFFLSNFKRFNLYELKEKESQRIIELAVFFLY